MDAVIYIHLPFDMEPDLILTYQLGYHLQVYQVNILIHDS